VSGHPLEDFLEKIEQLKCGTVADLASAAPEARVRLAGVVSDFTVRNTKKGDKYAYFRLEDLSGATVKCVLWPEAFKSKGRDAANDALLLVTGRLDDSDSASTVVCDEVYLLEKARIPAHNPWLNRNGNNGGVAAATAAAAATGGGQSVAAGGGRSSSSSSSSRVIRSLVIELPTGTDIGEKCAAIAQALRDSPGDCEVFLELHLREEGFRVRAQPSRLIRVCQDQRLDDALAAAGVRVNWVEMNAAS
jgi:hypothetical protein